MHIVNLSNYVQPKLLNTHEQSCNCSMFQCGSNTYLISRCVTYFLSESYGFVANNQVHTTNYLYEIDRDFNLQKVKALTNPYVSMTDVKYNGLEDIRTINWDGTNYFLCTKVLGNSDEATMCYGQISTDTLDLVNITECRTNNSREKNWAPIETSPFRCMYSHHPLTKINITTMNTCKLGDGISSIRGSSAIIRYNSNSLISLVHTKDISCKYVHRLVMYDNDLHIVAISQPFTFMGARTEFCSLLKIIPDGILLLPAINDGISYAFSIPTEIVTKLFQNQLNNSNVDPKLYNKLVIDALTNKAYEVAATSACMATDKHLIAAAIKYNYECSDMDFTNKCKRQDILMRRYNNVSHQNYAYG